MSSNYDESKKNPNTEQRKERLAQQRPTPGHSGEPHVKRDDAAGNVRKLGPDGKE